MVKEFAEIKSIMLDRLSELVPSSIEIVDESHLHTGHGAAGAHVSLALTSAVFSGKPRVVRHRMIYNLINDLMQKDIHALSIHAFSPEE